MFSHNPMQLVANWLYSLEESPRDVSNEYPLQIFLLKKNVTLLCIGTFYSCNGMYVPNFSSYEILKWTAH